VLERLKQKALVHTLGQPFVKESVHVFRDSMQLEFLATGVWSRAEQQGAIMVGPYISKVYHPQVLHEMSQKERLPLAMQRQLQQSYTTLPMIDEAKEVISGCGALGVNPKVIQERLGHANVTITLGRYAHVTESMQHEANKTLNQAFKRSQGG
jgi:hypothetical protein